MVVFARRLTQIGVGAGGLLCALAAAFPAVAAEQIVLPFECRVAGGRVIAQPSQNQAYRIHGTRVQRRFSACSRRNPERCRTFQIHSFTMACGRGRVSWPEFYAAISEATGGQAELENGQLIYRFGQSPDPRGETYGFDDPYPERGRGRALVAMPRGFAPLTGSEAIFTPLDPRVAALEDEKLDAATTPAAEPAPDKPAPAEKPPVAVPQTVQPSSIEPPKPKPAVKPTVPAHAPATESAPAPQPEVKANAAVAAAPPESPAPSREPADAPPKSGAATGTAPETPLPVTILNNPAAQKLSDATRAQDSGPSTVVAAQELTPAPTIETAPIDSGAVQGWSSDRQGYGIALPPIVFAIGIALATLVALVMILRRQAQIAQPVAGPAPWPAAEPELPGLGASAGGDGGKEPSSPAGQSLMVRLAAGEPTLSAAPPEGSGMPATRSEALEMLGLSADAGEAAIRKVVEGLRQSWHPDLATGDADRQAREERLKRINVASDILLRQPAA